MPRARFALFVSVFALALASSARFAWADSATPKAPAPAPPNFVIERPNTVEESCDPTHLDAMQYAPVKKMMEIVAELERRRALVLGESRRHEAAMHEMNKATMGGRVRIAAGVGLVLLLLGALLRPRGARIVFVVAGAAALFGCVYVVRNRGLHEEEALARANELSECQLRITDTRTRLQHAQLATCIHDLNEVDEDLSGWVSKVRGGGTLSLEEVTHLHEEVVSALH